jgi:hypothetical protein
MFGTRHRLLLAMAIVTCSCRKQVDVPHGAPTLLEVLWEVDGVPTLVWSLEADASVAPVAPAGGTKVDFVFDRRLDGARVEDTVDGNPVPKADPPITVSWPGITDTAMSDPPFVGDVFYNSLPDFGIGTTYAFVRPRIPGFPSATAITFMLDPNGLTSVFGEPMNGPTAITVNTTPLSVALQTSTATVSTSYMAPIVFSTRAPAGPILKAFIHLAVGSAAVPFDVVGDTTNAKRVFLVPICSDGWPSNSRIDITVEPGLPDGFGQPLAAGAKGSFMTSRTAGPPVDGGCGPIDAGAIDSGSNDDAANDGGTADAASDDGAGDAADASDDQSN